MPSRFSLLAKPLFAAVLALLLVGGGHACATQSLTPFEAHYLGYRSGIEIGTAVQKLEHHDNGGYTLSYSSEASLFFLSDKRYETSDFRFADGQLIPQRYHYKRRGTGRDEELTLTFDTQAQQVNTSEGNKLPWDGELDNQLYRYDFQRQLDSGDQRLEYAIINNRGDAKTYRLELLGEEVLDLPYGQIRTVKAQIVRDSKKRQTFIWFAPDLNHVMVRLQQLKNGKEQADVQLFSYEASNHSEPTDSNPG